MKAFTTVLLFSLVLILNSFDAISQYEVDSSSVEDYYSDNYLRYDNHSYEPYVKTVQLYPVGWNLGPPVMKLGEDKVLELNFDILDSSISNYMYTVEHCDHKWNPSSLDYSEYVYGPIEDYITEYSYSRNTYQKFVHYRLEIPNQNIQLLKSGNYLIKVYEQGNPEHLILTRRFCVAENVVTISAKIHQPTRVKERNTCQEVDFEFNVGQYSVTNPYADVHVVVMQNHTWETIIEDLQPRFMRETVFDYNYDGGNTFNGLNEFRLLDIKNTRFAGQSVSRITFNNRQNHAYLDMDKPRSSLVYLQKRDMNGWYYIKNDRMNTDPSLDADYVHVHFQLKEPAPVDTGDVYIFGALTDWQIKPEAKMSYSQVSLAYECELYLKQGLYNYMYALVKDGELKPDLSAIEGNHFQTENEYAIFVYHRQIGWDYDRLIGYQTFKFP